MEAVEGIRGRVEGVEGIRGRVEGVEGKAVEVEQDQEGGGEGRHKLEDSPHSSPNQLTLHRPATSGPASSLWSGW